MTICVIAGYGGRTDRFSSRTNCSYHSRPKGDYQKQRDVIRGGFTLYHGGKEWGREWGERGILVDLGLISGRVRRA